MFRCPMQAKFSEVFEETSSLYKGQDFMATIEYFHCL